MCVASSRNIFSGGSVFESENCLGNHLTGVGSYDPSSQDLVGLLISKNLDHAIWLIIASSSAVGLEWEYTFAVLDSFLLELLLGETDVGNLWV